MVDQFGYVPVELKENGLDGSLHVEQQVYSKSLSIKDITMSTMYFRNMFKVICPK